MHTNHVSPARKFLYGMMVVTTMFSLLGSSQMPVALARQHFKESQGLYSLAYSDGNGLYASDPITGETIRLGPDFPIPANFIRESNNIISVDDLPKDIVINNGYTFIGGQLSPSGENLVYTEAVCSSTECQNSFNTWLVNLVTHERTLILNEEGVLSHYLPEPVAWNLNNQTIYLDTYDITNHSPYAGLWKYNISTQELSLIDLGLGHYNGRFWLSPDSKYLLTTGANEQPDDTLNGFGNPTSKIKLINLDTEDIKIIANSPQKQDYYFVRGWVSTETLQDISDLANLYGENIEALAVPEATSGFQRPMTNDHYGWEWLNWTGSVYHPGDDYNGPGNGDADCNASIYAVANGTVRYVNTGGWGGLVIEHIWMGTTVYSQYGHITSPQVVNGQNISKGQHVANVGKVRATTCHLHWEIRESDHPNPQYGDYWSNLNIQSNVENWYEDPEWWVDNHGPYTTGCPVTSIPSGYNHCADEGGTCSFSGTANVIYGANSCYTSPRSFTNGVACNNDVLGPDPVPGVQKKCYTNASSPPPSGNWNARYFNGQDHWWDTNNFNNQMCDRSFNSSYLDRNYGSGSPCDNGVSDNWVAEYNATINFSSGNYVFQVEHDDGAKIWVGNYGNIGDYGGSGSHITCPARNLSGNVPIRVILREEGGDARIKVSWTTDTSICNPPGSFSKSTPSNGASGEPTNPTLSWGSSSGANKYYYCIDTSNNNNCDTGWQDVGNVTSKSLSGLTSGTTYYWHVRANNDASETFSNNNTWWSFTTQSTVSPVNILFNGGFENGSTSPDMWSKDAWIMSHSTFTWDTAQVHSGSRSVKISNNTTNDARWIQTVYVQPNSDYRLSGWIKTENIDQTRGDRGANLSYGTFLNTPYLSGTNDWTYVHVDFNTGSKTQVTIAARLGMDSGDITGTAWFDDLKLELLSASTCYSLTKTVSPSGSGSIITNPAPNCNGTQYVHGTVIALTAVPNAGYSFSSWSGNSNSAGFVWMTSNKSVTANFINTNPTVSSTTLRSIDINDGWILESTETSTAGGTMNSATNTFILGDDAQDRQYRAILHFDTSALPDTAIITSAILQLKKQGISGTNPFSILGSLRVDARVPSFSAAGLQLTDFRAAAAKNNIGAFNPTPSGAWYSAILNDTGKLYINRTGTTQFKIYFTTGDNDDLGTDFIRFYSGNAGAASRPKLVIQYYVPP